MVIGLIAGGGRFPVLFAESARRAGHRVVFRQKLALKEACQQVRAQYGGHPEIDHFVGFLEALGDRGLVR